MPYWIINVHNGIFFIPVNRSWFYYEMKAITIHNDIAHAHTHTHTHTHAHTHTDQKFSSN